MSTASGSVNLASRKASGARSTNPAPSGTPDVQVTINTAVAMTAGDLLAACKSCIAQLSGYLK